MTSKDDTTTLEGKKSTTNGDVSSKSVQNLSGPEQLNVETQTWNPSASLFNTDFLDNSNRIMSEPKQSNQMNVTSDSILPELNTQESSTVKSTEQPSTSGYKAKTSAPPKEDLVSHVVSQTNTMKEVISVQSDIPDTETGN